jgi:hypothetical protein
VVFLRTDDTPDFDAAGLWVPGLFSSEYDEPDPRTFETAPLKNTAALIVKYLMDK